jgi:hypothetical protein
MSTKIKDHYSEETRLALLEQSINNINNTLVRFEKRFDQIDAKFDKLDTKIDTNHKWCVGLISGVYILLGSAFITALIKFVH